MLGIGITFPLTGFSHSPISHRSTYSCVVIFPSFSPSHHPLPSLFSHSFRRNVVVGGFIAKFNASMYAGCNLPSQLHRKGEITYTTDKISFSLYLCFFCQRLLACQNAMFQALFRYRSCEGLTPFFWGDYLCVWVCVYMCE